MSQLQEKGFKFRDNAPPDLLEKMLSEFDSAGYCPDENSVTWHGAGDRVIGKQTKGGYPYGSMWAVVMVTAHETIMEEGQTEINGSLPSGLDRCISRLVNLA